MENWIQNAIFYHIYPLGFCGAPIYNSESVPSPRLDKLYSWIPHLKELGINALYLGPVCQSSKHGYDTEDYYRIDTRLGDNASVQALCQALHAAGIRVVLDGVFNHVGRNFWAFQDVQAHGQSSRYCGWFQNLRFDGTSPLGDPFQYESWGGHYELVKLNLRNPEVVEHLLGAVRLWMDEFHIDGLRLDAADCVDLDFFHALRHTVRERDPSFWLLGEIIHGDYNRWANPDTLDSVTNYECYKGLWSSHNSQNYFEIAHSLNRQFGPGGVYRGLRLYSFGDNHDVDRLASTLQNKNHLQNIYTMLYTMPGVPSVYYGGEWGLEGRRSATNDEALRPCLELEAMEAMEAGAQSLCRHLSRLAVIRGAFPALQNGDYENIVIKNEQLAYRRSWNGQRIYVVLNLSEGEGALDLPHQEAVLQDVLNGDQIFHNDGGRSYMTLAPCSARVLVGAPDRFVWDAPQGDAIAHSAVPETEVPAQAQASAEKEPAVSRAQSEAAAAPLEGRSCVVAGHWLGLGGALAQRLSDLGASLVLTGEEAWRETAEQLQRQGRPCVFYPCQFHDEGRVRWVMEEAIRNLGGMDSVLFLSQAEEDTAEPGDYLGWIQGFLTGPATANRFAAPHLAEREGLFLTVASAQGNASYQAALEAFTRHQSHRCAPIGVRVRLTGAAERGEDLAELLQLALAQPRAHLI